MQLFRRTSLLLLSAALIAGSLWFGLRHIDLRAAINALARANPALLMAAGAVNTLTILSQGQRLYALVRSLSPVSRYTAAEAVSLGFAGSQVLPARGGEVVKLTIVNRATSLNSSTLIGLITLENVINGFGLLILAVAIVSIGGAPGWVRNVALIGAIALPTVLFLFARLKPVRVSSESHRWRLKLQQLANSLQKGVSPTRKPRVLAAALGITMVSWVLEMITTWLTLRAFHLDEGLVMVLLLVLGVNMAILLPISPGQVGVYEIAATVVLTQAGVEPSTAVMVALLHHLVHMIPTFLVAGFFLFRRQLRGTTGV
jgi:uncharacterized protein (TIRG00374 family)